MHEDAVEVDKARDAKQAQQTAPTKKPGIAKRLWDMVRGKRRRLKKEDPNIYPLY